LTWNIVKVAPDLGEDLLVQIFDQGRTTGLSFYLHVKTVVDAQSLLVQNDQELSFDRSMINREAIEYVARARPRAAELGALS
jgi:hypothetical protein